MSARGVRASAPVAVPEGGFAVRSARPEDLRALVALEAEVFGEGWSEASLRNFLLAGEDVVLLAEAGAPRSVLGYVCFLRLADDVELLRLAVLPGSQRRGIGRALVERGLELHRPLGLIACYLEVRLDNHQAIGFYTRLGFEQVGARRSYYRDGCDAVLMSRRL